MSKQNIPISSVAQESDLIPLSLPTTADCVADIRDIILRARASVVRHVNTIMPLAYWLIGRRIIVEEQQGKNRAGYGERLLERISRGLAPYEAGDYRMTDDCAPVELLGMRVIDELIRDEVAWYKQLYREYGLKALIGSL